MSCEHDCRVPPAFPAGVKNRPGLPSVDYRIGDFQVFREHMLDALDASLPLAGWTHRGSDDPGIALLEGTAIMADILTFYQQLYANETFLRTAKWHESVSRLVQLSGYRLAPGIGGKATFSLEVTGTEPVTVPAGFGFKVNLESEGDAAIFETVEQCQAWPAQNAFHLYRPRKGLQPVTAGLTSLELHSVDGASDQDSLQAMQLRPGDRLLILPALDIYESGGGSWGGTAQARAEIAVVKETEQVLDRLIIHFEGALAFNRDSLVEACVIDRSFRHFGHNAPSRLGRLNETTGLMNMEDTDFSRLIYGTHTGSDFYSRLTSTALPLDQEVDDLSVGSTLICTGYMTFNGASSPTPFTVRKTVSDIEADTLVWGGINSSTTVVRIDSKLIANNSILNEEADIRRMQIHEAVSPPLILRAPSDWHSGPLPVTPDGYLLQYFGLLEDAESLRDRPLLLEGDDGRQQLVHVMPDIDLDPAGRDTSQPWLWPITLEQQPEFPREWFDESSNRVTIHGNLAVTTQGETFHSKVLGSGDARLKFQTLPLPEAPLTFHMREEASPPYASEIELRVNGLLWKQVEDLFTAGPGDRVYIVRQDESGESFVQCGDGITGAVFPSGQNNIEATFRKGNGGRGHAIDKVKPQGKLKALKAATLPLPATGGADPESTESARTAAPARMQSLGRLVALADFEAEAMALPGVLKARASWAAPTGTPLLQMAILTEHGYPEEAAAVQESLRTANRKRGTSRFPVRVITAARRFIMLSLDVGFDPVYRTGDVDQSIRLALGAGHDLVDESGLFGLASRKLGEGAHVSQVLAAVQQVAGVRWVQARGFDLFAAGSPVVTDPEALNLPATFPRRKRIDCSTSELLALHQSHLVLSLSADQTGEDES